MKLISDYGSYLLTDLLNFGLLREKFLLEGGNLEPENEISQPTRVYLILATRQFVS